MTTQEIREALDRITTAAGSHAVSKSNPCGVVASYEPGHALPWVVADDWYSDRYETAEAAEQAAREWAVALES